MNLSGITLLAFLCKILVNRIELDICTAIQTGLDDTSRDFFVDEMALENNIVQRINNNSATISDMQTTQISILNNLADGEMGFSRTEANLNAPLFDFLQPSDNVVMRIGKIEARFFTDNNAVNINDNSFNHRDDYILHIQDTQNDNTCRGCQIKTNAAKNRGILPLLSKLAGDESLNWHPFLVDFILIAQKLEQIGFTYFKGTVTVIDPVEEQ